MTAGDELCDSTYFPWFNEVVDFTDYYNRRDIFFKGTYEKFLLYTEENKKLAYPSIIAKNLGCNCINLATPGASLRTNVLKIIQLVNSEEPKADRIFLQIPPSGREFYFNERQEFSSLQMSSMNSQLAAMKATQLASLRGNELIDAYITIKAMTHSLMQSAIEDFSDLVMLDAYLKSKNIPLILIDISTYLVNELNKLPQFQYLVDQVSAMSVYKLMSDIDPIPFYNEHTLIGGHLSQAAHKVIADKLQKYINE